MSFNDDEDNRRLKNQEVSGSARGLSIQAGREQRGPALFYLRY